MKSKYNEKFQLGLPLLPWCWFTSRTSEFDKWNKNPNEATPDQRENGQISQLDHLFPHKWNMGHFCGQRPWWFFPNYWNLLAGGQFGGYFCNLSRLWCRFLIIPTTALPDGWVNEPFNAYRKWCSLGHTIKRECDKDGNKSVILATVVKVLVESIFRYVRSNTIFQIWRYHRSLWLTGKMFKSSSFAELDNVIDVFFSAIIMLIRVLHCCIISIMFIAVMLSVGEVCQYRCAYAWPCVSVMTDLWLRPKQQKSINSAAGFDNQGWCRKAYF